jgi:2'-5' RNA ligase
LARFFVAIRPPPAVREALLDAADGIDGARWQDDDQLHLTLAFCGEVDGAQANDLAEALTDVEATPFPLQVAGIGHFERKGVATAVWAAIAPSQPLAQLHGRVERACRRAAIETERRAFRPHITLARLPRSAGPIGAWLSAHGTLRAGPWEVSGFTLYESHLRSTGSLYLPRVDYEF